MENSQGMNDDTYPKVLGEFVGFKNQVSREYECGWVDQAKYISSEAEENIIEYVIQTHDNRQYTFVNPDCLLRLNRILPNHEMTYIGRNS